MKSSTWTCMVCGEDRPEALIAVQVSQFPLGGQLYCYHLRHCTDRPECRAQVCLMAEEKRLAMANRVGVPAR